MHQATDQKERNQREWEHHGNWTGPRWLGIYHAPRDSRDWVPKPIWWLGWTVNLAQPGGRRWALVLVLGFATLAASALWFV